MAGNAQGDRPAITRVAVNPKTAPDGGASSRWWPDISCRRSTTLLRHGGLLSYGPNTIDLYRRTASYVDRILKGEKTAELPVQEPTKVVLAINLKTAKALGQTVLTAITGARRA